MLVVGRRGAGAVMNTAKQGKTVGGLTLVLPVKTEARDVRTINVKFTAVKKNVTETAKLIAVEMIWGVHRQTEDVIAVCM
jgi:hypothetical protein